MSKTLPILLPLLATLAFGPAFAYGQNQAATTTAQTKSTEDVLATVNGTAIREADIRFALSRSGHNKKIPPEHRKNVLEAIIRRELIYQKAIELGLDANPRYQEQLHQMQAKINAFKREALSDVFYRREIAGKANVSDAEAKKYFADNAARIRTELHVWQILRRTKKSIERVRDNLKDGTSFEQIVKKQFPKLPKTGRAPWDLGYLRWKQVPKSWRSVVYDLRKGQVSGVIRGPNKRFWIIKLIDTRENPDITFSTAKPVIMEVLKNARIKELREKTDRDLRAKAHIVYSKNPIGASE